MAMRKFSEVEIKRMQALTRYSIEFAVIEPTATGLTKSIMDATGPLRNYLKAHGVHDFEIQMKGPENKACAPAFLVYEGHLEPSQVSLYRPQTKNGDPRIWFKGLPKFAHPHDILGIIELDEKLYVVNFTETDVETLVEGAIANPLKEIVSELSGEANETADELLQLLRARVGGGRKIPSLLDGADTAIGRTLETILGIQANSSKNPDYKGIELKSFRDNRGNRKTLFAQIPDWDKSKFKSSKAILDAFGYTRGEDFKLYCTVSALKRNSQGLSLRIDEQLGNLLENSDKSEIGDFVTWTLEILHKRLTEKHNETFWVAADQITESGRDFFVFKSVEHTKKPIISQFDTLIGQDIITVDHLIKRTANGKVVEKGPLFKIKPNALGLLFPPSETYSLIS